MSIESNAKSLLRMEARSLLVRLALVKPFALQETMLPAATPLPAAQSAIDEFLVIGRRDLRSMLLNFLRWLEQTDLAGVTAAEAQARFVFLRLKFNAVLDQLDMFSDVITQRSESETGVWLAGLDVVAGDALALPDYYAAPPVICYLDRGVGAAIRRARTRMPGGGENPVAIVRVPRERMVGSGIASSLIHEVGHQAAALLGLVDSLRQTLKGMQRNQTADRAAWYLWERWISEIISDFWSVARVGITSTVGLIGVVSLPRTFVFRLNADDPHPIPWIRVKLSAAIGDALYPHPQWARLSAMWDAMYPLAGVAEGVRQVVEQLLASMPGFISLLINHRPKSLRGNSLREVMDTFERQPTRLAALYNHWLARPSEMYRAAPSMAFAVIGQARANVNLSPEDESKLLTKLLTFWALRATVNMTELCTAKPAALRAAA